MVPEPVLSEGAEARFAGDECSSAPAAVPPNTVPNTGPVPTTSPSTASNATPAITQPRAFETDFVSLNGWEPRTPLGSVIATGRAGTRDGRVVELRYPGDPALGPADRVGPVHWPVELGTREPLHFGEYRVAVEFARCSANEELVNGIFVYANDGEDHDRNGIVDNPEIDVEVLCSAPYLYWMTVWTDYQPDPRGARFRKQTRVLDFRNGRYRETPPCHCLSKIYIYKIPR